MNDLTGNKGEWSEVYAFLRIIADGRLYGADGNIQKRDDLYYDVIRVIRQEDKESLDYVVTEDGKTAEVRSGKEVLLKIDRSSFKEEADYLLNTIKNSAGPSFPSPRTQDFMSRIRCFKIKAPSSDKSDITIQIHDFRTNMDPILGFSIKSKLGHPSTLLNAGNTTNVLFVLNGYDETSHVEYGELNLATGKTRLSLSDRYTTMLREGVSFDYVGMDNETFEGNLTMIDSNMPQIVAEMLKLHYIHGISSIEEQARRLEKDNPLGFKTPSDRQLYQYKIKKFLAAVALGMKPATSWNGSENATGGYIIVKEDGEVLCYHVYNRNDFEDYLFKNTKLDTPSTSRYSFSKVFQGIDGRHYVKLNLQIRFK